jgi:uncharacterized repeat protein (TIGR03803 family)
MRTEKLARIPAWMLAFRRPKRRSVGKLSGWKKTCAVFLLGATTVIVSPAQTLTTLFSFDRYTSGAFPSGSLVQGFDGNFYGTTFEGGANNSGTVFKITPSGTLTTLYSFCAQTKCMDGSDPYEGLVQATDGNFYGTTYSGGRGNCNGSLCGTVFKITPSGTLTTLYSFCAQTNCPDGGLPYAALVQATDGNFYGTTTVGGISNPSCGFDGCGTVFKITPSGTLTRLYEFCAQAHCTDGMSPYTGLVQAADGHLYGTTAGGGENGFGTIFKVIRSGTVMTLHSFHRGDGDDPSGLVQATDGNFYGTTSHGGSTGNYGTVYKVTPGGMLTADPFHGTDGADPGAGVVQATDGNFYGTTDFGGSGRNCNPTGGCGTVFKIGPGGARMTLYSFCVQAFCPDGGLPFAGLLQATDGNFYAATSQGGTLGYGTVFRLSVGLGPFVKTLPTSGKVGTAVIILGTNLTDATSVDFNGTAATFTVVSTSEITTTVPTGATTGMVQVTTPIGTLLSNVAFRVTP